jgi:hypothetical protein
MEIGTLIAGLLTLAIFSFLYRDNPFYKFAEYLLIGVSIGYALVITWSTTLMDRLFVPLMGESEWHLVVPGLLGLMMFARLYKKTAQLSRIPIAVLIGAGAGLAIPAMLYARTLRQLGATVAPLITPEGWPSVTALVVVIGVITTISYFYFSREHRGFLGGAAKLGTYFLMIFFGTTFGYTVMSRMSIFIGRVEFLLSDFLQLTR